MTTMMNKLMNRARLRAAVRVQRGMTLLEIMIVLAILALVMAFLVGPAVINAFSKSKTKVARWRSATSPAAPTPAGRRQPGQDLPGSISELGDYINKSDMKDPWGTR
jgi:prepilin-type N-terminal cleavage/methylation domain-containing protein